MRRPTTQAQVTCAATNTPLLNTPYTIIGDTASSILYAHRLLKNGVTQPITILIEGNDHTNEQGITRVSFPPEHVNDILHYLMPEKIHLVNSGQDSCEFDTYNHSQSGQVIYYHVGSGVVGDMIANCTTAHVGPWFTSQHTLSRAEAFVAQNTEALPLSPTECTIGKRIQSLLGLCSSSKSILVKDPSVLYVNYRFTLPKGQCGTDRNIFRDAYHTVSSASNVIIYTEVTNLHFNSPGAYNCPCVKPDNSTAIATLPLTYGHENGTVVRAAIDNPVSAGGCGGCSGGGTNGYSAMSTFKNLQSARPYTTSVPSSSRVTSRVGCDNNLSYSNLANNSNDQTLISPSYNAPLVVASNGPSGIHTVYFNAGGQPVSLPGSKVTWKTSNAFTYARLATTGGLAPREIWAPVFYRYVTSIPLINGDTGVDLSPVPPAGDMTTSRITFSVHNLSNNRDSSIAWACMAYTSNEDLSNPNQQGATYTAVDSTRTLLIIESVCTINRRRLSYNIRRKESEWLYNSITQENNFLNQFKAICASVIQAYTGAAPPASSMDNTVSVCDGALCNDQIQVSNSTSRQSSISVVTNMITSLYNSELYFNPSACSSTG